MTFNEMFQWWNVIYIAPLGVSVIWILATVMGGIHGHSSSHDGGHGFGHGDAGHGHDIGAGHGHADGGHHVAHGDHGAHGDHADHGGRAHTHEAMGHAAHTIGDDFSSKIISILGLDQVPITLIIALFLLCWGAFGMMSNQFFSAILKYPSVYIWPSLGVTFIATSVVTRSVIAILGRVMPGTETYGFSRLELVGSVGKTVFAVTETSGTIDIKDGFGTVHREQAKTVPGTDPLPRGADVIVIDYDETDNRFIVRQSTI